MTVSINIEENVSFAVERLLKVNGPLGYKLIGTAVADRIRAHFVEQEKKPNSKGWPKQHFFDQARRQTHMTSNATEATVTVSLVGFKTHFMGKPKFIRPINTRYLTIPARPEAYGRRAREFSDLQFAMVLSLRGFVQPALVRAKQTLIQFSRKRKDGSRVIKSKQQVGGEVYFWLARRVETKPHPDAFPKTEVLQEAAVSELQQYVESL